MKALAIERGDGNAPSKPRGLAEVDVREEISANSRASPPLVDRLGPHYCIEGYTPRCLGKTVREEQTEEEEDMLPTI